MEKRSEAKSIRMTPTVKDYIENFKGEGFNDKLHNVVMFAVTEEKNIQTRVKKHERRLAELNAEIDRKYVQLREITDTLYLADKAKKSISDLEKSLER